jgi:glycine/D-amino acid oxidase-like deaminating enzyme
MLNENYGIWLENTERTNYPRGILPENTEVLIVGGGITGITSAYLLAKEGKRVVLLEKKKIGEGVTYCTTGFLTQAIDTDPTRLIKLFGVEKAKLILASHTKTIDDIEKIISSEKIECEFKRCINYIYANNHEEERGLLKMIDAFKILGIKAEYKKDNALKFAEFGYIEMPSQAKFHVIKYMTALAKLAKDYGAAISEDTEVLNLESKNGFVVVKTKDAGIILAKEVLSATYVPFGELPYLSHRCNMYRTYVIEYKLPAGAFAEGTYQDNIIPYHYFRVDSQDGYDRMIIGGADHLDVLKINHEINYRLVKDYAEKLLTGYKYEEIRHWSGLILNSIDGLAYLGESKGANIFYAFAFSGNGMTYSHLAGTILLDKLMSRANVYSEIYDTGRKISWRANIFG